MSSHSADVFDMKRLSELYLSDSLMDLKLIAGPPENRVEIKAHKVVLALASQFFYEMFRDSSPVSVYKVYAMDPTCLNTIIGFIYTGRLTVSEENVEELFQAAELLGITRIKDKCQEYVTNNVDDTNWGRRLKFARKHNCLDLTDVVISYISNDGKYLNYMQTSQFRGLDYEEVHTILNAPARLDTPEESIFTSVIKWLKADIKDRTCHAARLLKHLDLTSLPQDFLQFHVDQEEVLHTFDCLQVYKKVVKSLGPQHGEESIVSNGTNGNIEDEIYMLPLPPSASPHKPMLFPPGKIFKFESRIRENDAPDLTTPPTKKLKLADKNESESSMTTEPFAENSAALEHVIPKKFTARKKTGGLRHHYEAKPNEPTKIAKPSSTTIVTVQNKPNLLTSVSSNVPAEINCKRTEKATAIVTPTQVSAPASAHMASTMIPSPTSSIPEQILKVKPRRISSETGDSEFVVYLREYNGDARVMMSDLTKRTPRQLRPFCKNNKSPALVWSSAARRLYALGGLSTVLKEAGSSQDVRYSSETSLMKHTDKEKYWPKGPQMIQERSKFKAVVLGDYIYAFGGAEGVAGNEAVNCAERLSVVAKNPKWEEIDFLQRARHGFGTGIIDGKIYVCGGYGATDGSNDAKMGILGTVECYDPAKDEWKFVASMIQERHNLSVAVLDSKLYAIGGGGVKSHTDPEADFGNMTSVELYDPVEDSWTLIGNLNKPRKNGSAVTLHGRIYAIGGDHSNRNGKIESSVEVYSPEEDKWTVCLEHLDNDGNFSTLAIIDKKDT